MLVAATVTSVKQCSKTTHTAAFLLATLMHHCIRHLSMPVPRRDKEGKGISTGGFKIKLATDEAAVVPIRSSSEQSLPAC